MCLMMIPGTTSILHDTEDKTTVASCSDPGCYTKQIKYNATLRQMVMLADISGSCQQYFRVINHSKKYFCYISFEISVVFQFQV